MTDSTPAVRASDAEREQAVARCRDAMTEGRLTLDEFSQRMESAYAAKTSDDLERIVSDLPQPAAAALPAARRRANRFTISIFSGSDRKGRWHVARKHWVISIFGGSDLDFRDASLEGGESTVHVIDVFGGTDLYVPEGIDVDFHGFGLFGGTDEHGHEPPPRPGVPVLHIVAIAVFGGTDLWRVPTGATGKRGELRRAARAAERDR
jgi:hypothetical protein